MRKLIFKGYGEEVERLQSVKAFSRISFRSHCFAKLVEC